MRADARRNYERLVAAADAAFRAHGTDASLDDVARRAGVGIGTLYRHFPTREALLETVLRERNAGLQAEADVLIESEPPGEALLQWARVVIAHASTYRGLAQAFLLSQHDEDSDLKKGCEGMGRAAGRLVANARRAGAVRDDLTAEDLMSLVNAIAAAAETAPDAAAQADRLLDLAFRGLTR